MNQLSMSLTASILEVLLDVNLLLLSLQEDHLEYPLQGLGLPKSTCQCIFLVERCTTFGSAAVTVVNKVVWDVQLTECQGRALNCVYSVPQGIVFMH